MVLLKNKTPNKIGIIFSFGCTLKMWKDAGLLTRECRLYDSLVDSGDKVFFFTYGGEEDRIIAAQLEKISVVTAFSRDAAKKSRLRLFVHSFLLPFVWHKELRKLDVIKTNQVWGGWVGVISKWLFNKPLIVRGGYEPVTFIRESGAGTAKYLLAKKIVHFTYRAADVIHMATTLDRDTVVHDFGVNPRKVSVIPNWIDTDLFSPSTIVPKFDDAVLAVGRLSWQKNISFLIEALQGTDIRLDLVGVGEEQEALRTFATDRDVQVRFLGKIDNHLLPKVYRAYRVYVMSSRFEGNPKTLLEAMACGLAVVCTDVMGVSNLIDHNQDGLLVKTPDEFRAEIKRLLDDPLEAARLGTAAQQKVRTHHSLDCILKKEREAFRGAMMGGQ